MTDVACITSLVDLEVSAPGGGGLLRQTAEALLAIWPKHHDSSRMSTPLLRTLKAILVPSNLAELESHHPNILGGLPRPPSWHLPFTNFPEMHCILHVHDLFGCCKCHHSGCTAYSMPPLPPPPPPLPLPLSELSQE